MPTYDVNEDTGDYSIILSAAHTALAKKVRSKGRECKFGLGRHIYKNIILYLPSTFSSILESLSKMIIT